MPEKPIDRTSKIEDEDEELDYEIDDIDDDEDVIEIDTDEEDLDEDLAQEIALADEIHKLEQAMKLKNASRVPIPKISSESSDDPVRLYLKEIGQVDLLDVDHEFWLATQLEAEKMLDKAENQLPDAKRGGVSIEDIFRSLYNDLATHWKHILEDTKDLKVDPPDFLMILKEAQQLQTTWQLKRQAYLREYLDNGMWSRDEDWDEVARASFKLFVILYLLPFHMEPQLKL